MDIESKIDAPKTPDWSITRVPFDTEGTPWTGPDVRLFRMADTLHGPLGEAADYVLTSTIADEDGVETVVVPANENGEPVGILSPVMHAAESADPIAVLAELGFVDVTAEA